MSHSIPFYSKYLQNCIIEGKYCIPVAGSNRKRTFKLKSTCIIEINFCKSVSRQFQIYIWFLYAYRWYVYFGNVYTDTFYMFGIKIFLSKSKMCYVMSKHINHCNVICYYTSVICIFSRRQHSIVY